MDQSKVNIPDNSDEISIKDVVLKIRAGIKFLKSKWLTILAIGILGGALGLVYAIFKKPVYTAECTFVLDESSSRGGAALGQYAGLASLAGIDLGGSNSNGLFQGDNILELYRSRLMIEKVLLSSANFNGKNELLIDRYVNFNKLRKKWKRTDDIDSITFNDDPAKFNRKQDSIVTDLVEEFNKKMLNVSRPDKKLSIIKVDVSSKDELFAKYFNDYLVQNVNTFYIQTITKKASQNLQVLQKQADSVRRVLDSSLSGVASAIDASPNANPFLLTLKVPSQKKQIDVQASTAIYSGIVQNLEIAKVTLRQETPLIQVIDTPILPLKVDKLSKLKGIIIGLALGLVLSTLWLSVKGVFNNKYGE